MNKNRKYAFYGSLRAGMYNYERTKTGLNHLGTKVVSGYKLYSLGPYPCAIFTGDDDDKLTVDIFDVSQEQQYRIHQMELGAGYDYEEVSIDGTMYGIYLYPKEAAERLKDRNVPSGDWVKHLQPKSETV